MDAASPGPDPDVRRGRLLAALPSGLCLRPRLLPGTALSASLKDACDCDQGRPRYSLPSSGPSPVASAETPSPVR